jgi:hypothetical protein
VHERGKCRKLDTWPGLFDTLIPVPMVRYSPGPCFSTGIKLIWLERFSSLTTMKRDSAKVMDALNRVSFYEEDIQISSQHSAEFGLPQLGL